MRFVDLAASELGIQLTWRGQGVEQKRHDAKEVCRAAVDPRYFRATEVESLPGDSTKGKRQLGWQPKTSFGDLVRAIVRDDLRAAERDELVKQHGFHAYECHE